MPTSLRSILILSSHLRLGLPKDPSLQVYLINIESAPTFFHSGYMTCPSQSSRLNHPDDGVNRYHLYFRLDISFVVKVCLGMSSEQKVEIFHFAVPNSDLAGVRHMRYNKTNRTSQLGSLSHACQLHDNVVR